MTRPTRQLRRAFILAIGATLLLAVPAAAHPFIQGGDAPVDSLASLTLDLAHGCSADGDAHGDGEEPTTEVALEVPEEMRITEVPDVEGFEVELEADGDGRVEVVTWIATTSTAPAPELPFDAVLSGDPGDEIFLRVFQACDDLSYRWVGTPDAPAEDPAVRLTLTEADPDNPAPGPDEVLPAESQAAPEDPEASEEPTPEEAPATVDEEAADEGAEEEAQDADAEETIEEADEEITVATPGEPEDSPLLWGLVILVGGVLVIALILGLRRRPAAAAAPNAVAGDDPDAEADETEIR